MNLIHILIQITLVNCNLKLKEGTDKIKSILNQYKIRQRRCDLEIDNFVNKTVNFLIKNERFGDILNNYNVSKCGLRVKHLEKHVSSLLIHEDVPEEHWMEYKTVFNKSYETNHHETVAKTTWLQNLQLVAKHNREYLSGKISYSLQLNHFGDWHVNDYISGILKLQISTIPLFDPARDYSRVGYRSFRHHKVPRSLDWRDLGFKPRREEQWRCGACYAFAVTHAIQAQLYNKHRKWDELSPQQIVDCSYEDGNQGCNGGSLQAAFRYAAREGLARETKYPYRGKKGRCHSWGTVRVRPRRWAALPARNEAAIESALANIGPLAVAVNAAPITFQLYRSGIYDDPFCVPWRMNHAMLLVGYTPQYWLLLNWWGRKWGEDGYIRIRRGLNTCGVSNMAMYVEL
ncbi:PREDICTED: cathepsin L1-like [Papilio polytes]|uniref:cathepsin L1-like n=1 Tax=Papilio polytes TaxID=76194 RepID=UPI0006761A66|nr:PREDICTED: cathepsin L1-like [Papilio polytes]